MGPAGWAAVRTRWQEAPAATRGLLLGLLACAAWVLLWPGDIPWINDEPALLGIALDANRDHQLALLGLPGSVGVLYGPVPAWCYQVALLVTHDPVWIGLAKTALSLALLGWVCWRLAERLDLPRAPLLLVFLSPYVYHYTRILWDNSITLVLSPLLLYACVETMRRQSWRALVAALVLSTLLIHCHLNNALIILPCGVVLLASERRWLLAHRGRLALALGLTALSVVPYALYVVRHLHFQEQFRVPLYVTLTGVAWGAKYFSYAGFAWSPSWPDSFVPEMYSSAFLLPASVTWWLVAYTAVAFIWFVIGLVFVVRDLWNAPRDGRPWSLRQKYGLLVLLTFALNALFFGLSRQTHVAHYLVGTWMTYGYCVWRGAAWLLQRPQGRWRLVSYAAHGWFWSQVACMALLLLTVKVHLHLYGGNREPYYGATLGNQMEVVRASFAYSPASPVDLSTVYNYAHFQHAFHTLTALLTPTPLPADWHQRPTRPLRVRYANPADPVNGWLVLDEP